MRTLRFCEWWSCYPVSRPVFSLYSSLCCTSTAVDTQLWNSAFALCRARRVALLASERLLAISTEWPVSPPSIFLRTRRLRWVMTTCLQLQYMPRWKFLLRQRNPSLCKPVSVIDSKLCVDGSRGTAEIAAPPFTKPSSAHASYNADYIYTYTCAHYAHTWQIMCHSIPSSIPCSIPHSIPFHVPCFTAYPDKGGVCGVWKNIKELIKQFLW